MPSLAPEVDLDDGTSGARLGSIVEVFDPRWPNRDCVPKLIDSNGADMEHVRTVAYVTEHQVMLRACFESHRCADPFVSMPLLILLKPSRPPSGTVGVSNVRGGSPATS